MGASEGQARWGAVVPAGGAGTRMRGGQPKQFIKLGHCPVIIHTLSRLASCPELESIIVAVPSEMVAEVEDLIGRHGVGKIGAVVPGGETRQRSVSLGLAALALEFDYILVHDAVRPLVDQALISRVIKAAREIGAATAAIPVQDTLAQVGRKGFVSNLPPRTRLWQVQTPQAFWRPHLEEAQQKAWADNHLGTDEAGLVVRLGRPVKVVDGSPLNLKLTTPHDLKLAEAMLGLGEV